MALTNRLYLFLPKKYINNTLRVFKLIIIKYGGKV